MKRFTTPYLHLCPNCQVHAHIVFADGSKSREFVIREAGLELLREGYRRGLLTFEESKMVEQQINKTDFLSIADLRKKLREVLNTEKELEDFLGGKTPPEFKGCILN